MVCVVLAPVVVLTLVLVAYAASVAAELERYR